MNIELQRVRPGHASGGHFARTRAQRSIKSALKFNHEDHAEDVGATPRPTEILIASVAKIAEMKGKV
jgi:hypothetical protein